jgi:hypothetical protein
MADNETEAPKKVIPPAPTYNIVCERNGVTLTSADKEIIAHRRLKGKKENTYYPTIDLNLSNKEKVLKWLGDATLVNMIARILRGSAQAIATDSVNNEGIFDESLFAKKLSALASTGMKISDIQDLIDELTAQATQFIDQGYLVIDGVKVDACTVVDGKPVFAPELKKINDDIRSYRQMKEDKQREPKNEAVDESAVPSVAA